MAGPPLRSNMTGAVRRPIMHEGRMIGEAVLLPIGPSPRGIETEFLRDQFTGIAILVAFIFAIAALAALFIARRGAALLADIGTVASSVADGDFTKRTKAKGSGEIAMLAASINQMAEKLGSLQQARRTWLAEVGHELRTPLTVLQGELEALNEEIRPLNKAALRSLDEEAHRLSLLVDDLQFMAISDIAKPSFRFTSMTVEEILAKAENRFSLPCEAAGLALDFRNSVPNSIKVHWDIARMEQLLANLISNSKAYTDAPGRIQVTASQHGPAVRLTVQDSKPGVSKENLGRLFDPLFRAEKSRARHLGGSGLGLSVCSVIAKEHGGTIEAQTSDLGGLKVVVTIPLLAGRLEDSDREMT